MSAGGNRALWYEGEGSCSLREMPTQALLSGHSRVRARYSAISRGTESLVFHGRVPKTEYDRMRAPFQEGEFSFPLKYGYILVGEVSEGPRKGQSVFCLAPHQEDQVLPSDCLYPLIDGLSSERAVLCAGMETALNVLWDSGITMGDRVAVVGGGVLGLLSAFLAAQVPGVHVQVIDPLPQREEVALALGGTFALPGQGDSEMDRVIHASSTQSGLQECFRIAGKEAQITDLSWYGDREIALPLGGAFHSKRLRLCSSQVGSIASSKEGRWDYRRRMGTAMELLLDNRLDLLFEEDIHFSDLAARLPGFFARAGGLCQRVSY